MVFIQIISHAKVFGLEALIKTVLPKPFAKNQFAEDEWGLQRGFNTKDY